MARIPDEEIARIKRETELAALVRSRGVELAKHGSKDWVGRCPFHEGDERPSLIVSPDKGLFHCMGCGAAGNVIQFVEKFDGVSFRHAFELLSDGRAAFSAPASAPLKQATVPRLENPFADAAEDAALLARVVEFYQERLLKTPDALDYLKGRGIYSEEAVERFRLGFSDRSLGIRLPESNRRAGAAIRSRLQALGLIRESGHEHFSGSVVLPIYTAKGDVGEMYGRKITPNLRKGTPLHLYLPGPHEGICRSRTLIDRPTSYARPVAWPIAPRASIVRDDHGRPLSIGLSRRTTSASSRSTPSATRIATGSSGRSSARRPTSTSAAAT